MLFVTSPLLVSFAAAQYLKNDLMRQFDSQVNDFMDSLIEESASLENAPMSAVFSPPLSDKERSKLRCRLSASLVISCSENQIIIRKKSTLANDILAFLQAFSASSRPG